MKKIKYFMLIFSVLFLLPMMVHAADTANVSIKKVSLVDQVGDINITQEPKATGLNIDFGVEFKDVGDKVIYKAEIENKDNEDYLLRLPKSKEDGYVTYQYKFGDNSEILKANSTKELVITIEYKEEVPDNALENGRYKESNRVVLTLANDDGTSAVVPANPKTGQSIAFIIIIGFVVLGSSFVVFKNHKSAKNFVFLLAVGAFLLPISIYAIKELTITVNSSVEIARTKEFCVAKMARFGSTGSSGIYSSSPSDSYSQSYEYYVGMTFGDYFDSDLFRNSLFATSNGYDLDFDVDFARNDDEYDDGFNSIMFFASEDLEGSYQGLDSKIKDSSEGCYTIDGAYRLPQPE